jgi:hypothetical protein
MPPGAKVPASEESSPAWTIGLGRLGVEKWAARFEDRGLASRAVITLDPITLTVTDFSTAAGAKMGVEARVGINKTGRLQVKGSVAMEPFAANLRFDLRRLEIVPLQPYLQEQLNLTFTAGTVSSRGQMSFNRGTGTDPEIKATGDLEVADLATVGRAKTEPLVAWKSFRVSGIRFVSPPLVLSIGEVAATDLDARVILFSGGGLNLADAFAAPTATNSRRPAATAAKRAGKPAATAAAKPAPQLSIGKVTLQGNRVTFIDRSIHPTFMGEITDLRGTVSGLSSNPASTADLDLQASVNRTGALAIAGKLNPLSKKPFLDLQVKVTDVDLPPASPYSGKYAGLMISKGKLGLALDYKIADRSLAAKNRLLIDQLTFGEKVASPDATKLPVRLAAALLRDRRGLIDVTLPIEGSLDDPEFKIWRAVLKVLGNLLVKAATSPFTLLASAFGGGDELSRIDFPAGVANLDATGKKRVDTLAKVLQERPGISFELAGYADAKQDNEGLRRFLVERKVKAKKLATLLESGTSVASVDQIVIEPAEREHFVREAYEAETFARPKNVLGFNKKLPVAEMEKLMLANTRVTDDHLRALANRRATSVQAALAKTTPGATGRLFLVTPRVAGAGGFVELKLKD